jgi:methylenetetrahydrofolate reductase (NADPH)
MTKWMTPMSSKTKLTLALESGRMSLTAECLPPRGADPEAVKRLAACFPSSLDAVVVADNPDQIRSSALACAAMLASAGLEPVLSLVTRDRNRIALESEALGAAALGIKSVLCLTGEHQSLGTSPQAAGAFDMDSVQLCQAIKVMSAQSLAFDGEKLPGACNLSTGTAAHPYLRPMGLNLLRLKKKIQAGAEFMLTRAVFDLPGFLEWMEAVRAAGIDKQTAIIASVLPLQSLEQAKHLQEKKTYGPIGDDVIARISGAADAAEEGKAICVEMARKVKAVPGVRGVHILCGGCEEAAAQIIQEAELAQSVNDHA